MVQAGIVISCRGSTTSARIRVAKALEKPAECRRFSEGTERSLALRPQCRWRASHSERIHCYRDSQKCDKRNLF
jgi:hypothetical protein